MTPGAGSKDGFSDPRDLFGIGTGYWIKATLGITGWSHPIVHIDDAVRHLDVVLAHPGPEEGAKGWSVRPLKRCVRWVQSVARQLGLYPM